MAQHNLAEKGSDKISPLNITRPAIAGRKSGPLSTLQDMATESATVQRISELQNMANARYAPAQRRESSNPPNGLPQNLKSGIENLSGISMADVTVQRNSSEPAKVGAHAFAQGTNIHLGPGQDKHLPHEAWHVVQQKRGRVKPTMQMKGVAINDDVGLEREADVMGAKAMAVGPDSSIDIAQVKQLRKVADIAPKIQARTSVQFSPSIRQYQDDGAVSSTDRFNGLDQTLDDLEKAVELADKLAEQSGSAAPLEPENPQLRIARDIAESDDADAKAALYEMLSTEIGNETSTDSIALDSQVAVTQRVSAGGMVAGLALLGGLGYLARQTYVYLRNKREDQVLADYYMTGHIANPAIPAELNAGVAGLAPGAAAAQIFQNINAFRFRYTGQFVPPRVAFQARQGDCRTLVGFYQEVANANGVPFVIGSLVNQPHLVPAGPIHGRVTTSNTEQGTAWYFQEHFWAIGNGTAYDVLFMTTPPPAPVLQTGAVIHNNVTYLTFLPDPRCLIEPGQVHLGYDIQEQGRVFANAAAAIAFINLHP